MQERDSRKDDDKFLGDACGKQWKQRENGLKPLEIHWKAIGYTCKHVQTAGYQ